MKQSIILISFLVVFMLVFTACSSQQAPSQNTQEQNQPVAQEMQVYTIGSVLPLTGDGAAYGLPLQRVIQDSANHLNEKWASKNMKLEIVYEDGKCNGKDALLASQSLVNNKNVNIILGGLCSSETLGIAPYAEENQILLFSAASSSPDISKAGDYIFRNYPSDVAQTYKGVDFVKAKGWKRAAIISENTDYAQALRVKYKEELAKIGVDVVSDEVFDSSVKDVRTQITKTKNANPDFAVYIVQTPASGEILSKQTFDSNVQYAVLGSDIFSIKETIDPSHEYMQGYYILKSYFSKENDPSFIAMTTADDCGLGYYCATTYDAVTLLGELIETCSTDSQCIKDSLYQTQHWSGVYVDDVSFDENGDASGSFVVKQLSGTELVDVN